MEKSITVKLDKERLRKVRDLMLFALEDHDNYYNTSEIIRLAIDAFHELESKKRAEAAKELPF